MKGQHFRSDNLYKLLGVYQDGDASKDELWTAKIPPDDIPRVEKNLSDTLQGTGDQWIQEFRFRKSDGEILYVIDNGLIIRNKHGKAVRIIGSTQNITKRKHADRLFRFSANALGNSKFSEG